MSVGESLPKRIATQIIKKKDLTLTDDRDLCHKADEIKLLLNVSGHSTQPT